MGTFEEEFLQFHAVTMSIRSGVDVLQGLENDVEQYYDGLASSFLVHYLMLPCIYAQHLLSAGTYFIIDLMKSQFKHKSHNLKQSQGK